MFEVLLPAIALHEFGERDFVSRAVIDETAVVSLVRYSIDRRRGLLLGQGVEDDIVKSFLPDPGVQMPFRYF